MSRKNIDSPTSSYSESEETGDDNHINDKVLLLPQSSNPQSSNEKGLFLRSSSLSPHGGVDKGRKRSEVIIALLAAAVLLLLTGIIVVVVLCTKEKPAEEPEKGTGNSPGWKMCPVKERGVLFDLDNPGEPHKDWKYNPDVWDLKTAKQWNDGDIKNHLDFFKKTKSPLRSTSMNAFMCKIHNHLFMKENNFAGPQVIGWAVKEEKLESTVKRLQGSKDYVFKATNLMNDQGILVVRDGKVSKKFKYGDIVKYQYTKAEERKLVKEKRLSDEDVKVLESFAKGTEVKEDMLVKLGKVLLKADRAVWNDSFNDYSLSVRNGIIIEKVFRADTEIKVVVGLGNAWGYVKYYSEHPNCEAQNPKETAKSIKLAEAVARKLGIDLIRVDIAINAEGEPQIVELSLTPTLAFDWDRPVIDKYFPELVKWHIKRLEGAEPKTQPPENESLDNFYWPKDKEYPKSYFFNKE